MAEKFSHAWVVKKKVKNAGLLDKFSPWKLSFVLEKFLNSQNSQNIKINFLFFLPLFYHGCVTTKSQNHY